MLVQFACACTLDMLFPDAGRVCWMNSCISCVFVCVCVCPCDLSYDVYLTVGLQFQCRADVRISISPFHFQMGLNLQCPYWFIMTHFDYLSVGSHSNPKQHCSRGTKTHQDQSLETKTEE